VVIGVNRVGAPLCQLWSSAVGGVARACAPLGRVWSGGVGGVVRAWAPLDQVGARGSAGGLEAPESGQLRSAAVDEAKRDGPALDRPCAVWLPFGVALAWSIRPDPDGADAAGLGTDAAARAGPAAGGCPIGGRVPFARTGPPDGAPLTEPAPVGGEADGMGERDARAEKSGLGRPSLRAPSLRAVSLWAPLPPESSACRRPRMVVGSPCADPNRRSSADRAGHWSLPDGFQPPERSRRSSCGVPQSGAGLRWIAGSPLCPPSSRLRSWSSRRWPVS
jgi:hypothetical protein